MKRFSLWCSQAGIGAALILVTTSAQAQTPAPTLPVSNSLPVPGQLPAQRIEPTPKADLRFDLSLRAFPFVDPHFAPGAAQRLFTVPGTNPFRSTPSAVLRPDTMVIDGNFLHILRGDTLVKMDKKTLKVIGSTTLAPLTAPASIPQARTIPQWNQLPAPLGNHFSIGPQF